MVLVLLEDPVILDFPWLPALLGNLLNLVFPALPSYLVVQAILPYHLFQVGQIFQVILAFLGNLWHQRGQVCLSLLQVLQDQEVH